jgi:DNA-binding MarR family transcriptional regulator
MKLEEEIKQKKPIPSKYIRLMVNLIFTGSWSHEIANKHFKSFGVSNEQYNVLRILRGSYPKSLAVMDVQSRMVERSSNVTRLAAKLLDKKYITKINNPNNRRVVLLNITQSGLDLMASIDQVFPTIEKKMHNLSEEEAEQLNQLLDKLRS